jgi:hypothetical protein
MHDMNIAVTAMQATIAAHFILNLKFFIFLFCLTSVPYADKKLIFNMLLIMFLLSPLFANRTSARLQITARRLGEVGEQLHYLSDYH